MARHDASGADASDAQAPAPPDVVARADALMSRFPECFWFWRPDARIRSVDDVRLVVRQLREYGDRDAWLAARDLARCLARASERDVVSLRDAGFTVDTLSRHGEWERDATFRRALVRGEAGDVVEVDWAADSAFRFFPIERDPQLGCVCTCSTRRRTRR